MSARQKQLKEFEERMNKRKQQNSNAITIQRNDKPPLQLNQDQIVRLLQEQQNKIKELTAKGW